MSLSPIKPLLYCLWRKSITLISYVKLQSVQCDMHEESKCQAHPSVLVTSVRSNLQIWCWRPEKERYEIGPHVSFFDKNYMEQSPHSVSECSWFRDKFFTVNNAPLKRSSKPLGDGVVTERLSCHGKKFLINQGSGQKNRIFCNDLLYGQGFDFALFAEKLMQILNKLYRRSLQKCLIFLLVMNPKLLRGTTSPPDFISFRQK